MKTVHLQGIGSKPAKSAKDLKIGDKVMWNYGYTSTILDLIPSKTGKTIVVVLSANESDYVGNRKMMADRLVALA